MKQIESLKKAAESGDDKAQFELGKLLFLGEEVPMDLEQAREWFEKSKEQNNPDALYYLAFMYLCGEGVEQDVKKAVFLCQLAHNFDNRYASRVLIEIFRDGTKEIEPDETACLEYSLEYEGLVHCELKKKYPSVVRYETRLDYEKQRQLFNELYERGDADEQYVYAEDCLYAYNFFLPYQDEEDVCKLYRSSAEKGNADAQFRMGNHCKNTGIDSPTAWYKRAAEQGHGMACLMLGILSYNSKGKSHDYATAVEWFRKGADLGNDRAEYMLGHCYEKGLGVKENRKEALRWYRKAAIKANSDARRRLLEIRKLEVV